MTKIYLTNKFNKFFINEDLCYSLKIFTIFQVCLFKNIYIPRFCYHNQLKIAGNCRMCLVEEKKTLKPVASCAMNPILNFSFFTKTRMVKEAREAVLEYLLANHPLDCPICDQGGECDLQDQTMVFGGDRSRFYENFKKVTLDKNIGPIKTSLNRCIHCARCTRFLNDVVGDGFLNLLGRGKKMEISLYKKKINYNFDLLYGNIIDLCPVGALLSKTYSFLARPWEINTINSITLFDSLCSNIKIDFQGTKLVRIIPRINNFLNLEWICDKTRFFLQNINLQRLTKPFLLNNNFSFINISWFNFYKIFFIFNLINYKFLKIKLIYNFLLLNFIGYSLDIESLIFLKNYNNKIGNKIFFNSKKKNNFLLDFRKFYFFNLKSFNWNNLNLILLINLNLRYENPVLWLKLKNVVIANNFNFYIIGFLPDLNFNFNYLGNNLKKLLIINEFTFFKLRKLKNPFIIIGNCLKNLFSYFFLNNFLFKLNFFQNFSSEINMLELNIKINNKNFFFLNNFFTNKIFYLFNVNYINYNYNNKLKNLYIFQGNFNFYYTKYSDILLPTKLFFEQSSFYLNLEGWLQQTGKNLFNFSFDLVKKDYDILKILYNFLIKNKKINIHLIVNYLLNYIKINKLKFEDILINFFYDLNFKNFFFKNFIFFKNNFFNTSFYLNQIVKEIKIFQPSNLVEDYFFKKTNFKNLVNNNLTLLYNLK